MSLQQVLQRPDVWCGSQAPAASTVASGFARLDALLPGGGWPCNALTDIILPHAGIGELRLLLPALARLSGGERWIAVIAPPYVPFAPALAAAGVDLSRLLLVHPRTRAERLWSIETGLRAGACAAVLGWVEDVAAAHRRRWQLAAEAGNAFCVLFQRRNLAHSPAALRLQLTPAGKSALDINILKRRGGWPLGPVRLELDHAVAVRAVAGFSTRDMQSRRLGG